MIRAASRGDYERKFIREGRVNPPPAHQRYGGNDQQNPRSAINWPKSADQNEMSLEMKYEPSAMKSLTPSFLI